MADGDLVFKKRLCHGRYEVSEPDATIYIRLAFSSTGRDAGDGVGRFSESQECLEV
jgi:hypothetical protein